MSAQGFRRERSGRIGLVRMPQPESPTPSEPIWHYTSSQGLIGILTRERIWATTASMLNDSTELEYGLDLARQTLDEVNAACGVGITRRRPQEHLEKVLANVRTALAESIFVLCASQENDDLNRPGKSGESFQLTTMRPRRRPDSLRDGSL